MNDKSGKKEFYSKAKDSFQSEGYQYYCGDKEIKGKTCHHASKPDYIAIKENVVIIGEIKSPKEGPKTGSWRQIQNSDSESFKTVRIEVAEREKAGVIPKEIGGHEIIIRGQILDYINKIGKTFEMPESIHRNHIIRAGYTVPSSESLNVEQALRNCNKILYEKIDNGNEAVSYIYCI